MTANTALASACNAGELIERIEAVFAAADLFYGHGTDNPRDEAALMVFHVMELDHQVGTAAYTTVPDPAQRATLESLLRQRMESRKPLPYLLGEAWFAGRAYTVTSDVLIPRSPIAELIGDNFEPWLDATRLRRVLEIGTGSGCIAIACALALPQAQVTATDISAKALAVAAGNSARYGVSERVHYIETDLAVGVQGVFDLIISNPPYVPVSELADLPPEYLHEPVLGLVSGADGLDSARRILQDAPRLLAPDGVLILEVGAQWEQLERACPQLPFVWLEFAHGGTGVALLHATDFGAGL